MTELSAEFIEEYHAKVRANIATYGYHMTFVGGGNSPPFLYTAGLYHTFRIPEVFVSALPRNLSVDLVEGYVELCATTREVPFGQRTMQITQRFPVYLVETPVDNLRNHVLSSFRFYADAAFTYVQIIYPNTNGLFPGDPGYEYDQEILCPFPQ